MESFEYPKIHSFPPFFTEQPHTPTNVKQCEMWCNIIIDYCKFNKISAITSINAFPPFNNDQIKRKVNRNYASKIMKILEKRGQAEIIDENTVNIQLTPTADLARQCYQYIEETGQISTVLTIHEIFFDAEMKKYNFYKPTKSTLKSILKYLETQKLASLLKDSSNSGEVVGIKFNLVYFNFSIISGTILKTSPTSP